jgi:uncharacterized protein with ATP-grasp and redox domains
MSIGMNNECLLCLLTRHLTAADKFGNPEAAGEFAKALLRLYADAPADISTPELSDQVNDLYVEFFHLNPDRYRSEKEDSNRFALERLDLLRNRVNQAKDPIYAALQLAILGNYIDFGALAGEVSFDKLDKMLQDAEKMELDEECYRSLLRDLEKGKTLLYLTDNAGEIVFDRVFAETLQARFPHLEITFCVRGGPAANDATREDAMAVGIPFRVIDNGTRIPGTVPGRIGPEAQTALDTADVIISKGQGNCETLYGYEKNIYYAFLVKCARFIRQFGKPKLTPMLTK